ncbi:MAG: hypothetical protein GWN58_33260 [Anaerolineae bacterium]|nr:hypothetical protein [Thermoplasmata archaeon]NIV34145.1 hypothetical protein [Anaerolineae bacterium]NIY05996.1 hypothetical protein [Thermoplasmata archaeon]
MRNRSLKEAAAARRGNPRTKMVMVVRGDDEADQRLDMQHHGHDPSMGEDPLAPRPMLSEPPPGEPTYEQQGDLILVTKRDGRALVIDPRQHYLVITFEKNWWDGQRKDLGAIGRERALRAFDKELS